MRVLCVTSCYIDRYYEEGQEYPNYIGPPSPHLKPLDQEDDLPEPVKPAKKSAAKQ